MNEGWMKPQGTSKWHYFRHGISLCQRWIGYPSVATKEKGMDDCANCRRLLDQEKKEKK